MDVRERRRGLSSAGRAPALQAGGREFESLSLHRSKGKKGPKVKRKRVHREEVWREETG